MTGAELIASQLQGLGVTSVFAVAGASHMMLLDALDRAGIGIVSSRHESGCIGAADGYFRATGKLGVALIVADQGLANGIGGLSVASQAKSGVLVVGCNLPGRLRETQMEMDQNTLALVTPLTHWARAVPSAERLHDFFSTACRMALGANSGPVYLSLEEGFFSAEVTGKSNVPAVVSVPAPTADAIAKAAQIIGAAERPMILAGAGATRASAGAALAKLSQQFGIPVTANAQGRGVVPEDFKTSFSWPFAQIAATDADCVIVVGSRLTQRQGFGLPPRFNGHARFIQIDIDADNLNRNRAMDVAIHADARLAVEALHAELTLQCCSQKSPDWLVNALAPRAARVNALIDGASAEGPIHPLAMADAIARHMPEDAIYVGDGADIQSWMYAKVAIKTSPGFMDHYPQGAMGSGTPLAVGAAAAMADESKSAGAGKPRPVFLVTGDGSLGFHPAELHAAALAGLRLIVVVGNDAAWGTELHLQHKVLGRTLNTELGYLPYEKLAEAFGCTGLLAENAAQLDAALQTALECDGPVLINAIIDQAPGRLLKEDPLLRMIMFSDLVEGQEHIAGISGR